MKNILCYGDSNTYGYDPTGGHGCRYPKNKRWTTILQELLGDEYEVIPEGLNGRTTAYDRPGFPWKNGLMPLPAIMGSHKPVDYIVFMLGTNDCNLEMNLSAQDIADGMEQLIITAKEINQIQQEHMSEIVLVVPAPISDDYKESPFYGEIDISSVYKSRDLIPLYKDLAVKYDCLFINTDGLVKVSPIDAEHLSEQGHQVLAELIYQTIINNENK